MLFTGCGFESWGGFPIALLALLWATLPFWPESGIGTAFFPTIFYVFYQLYQGKKFGLKYFALILFYVIYSQLHLHGLFVGMAIFIFGIHFWWTKNAFNKNYWTGFSLLTLLYIGANYRLFHIYFFAGNWFIPHRAEYEIHSFAYFHHDFWIVFWKHLSKGILHGTYFSPFPILIGTLALLILSYKKAFKKINLDQEDRHLVKVFGASVILAALASILKYTPLLDRFEWMKTFNQFSYDRFSLFIAPLMMVVLALVLQQIFKQEKWLFWAIGLLTLSWHFLVLDDNHRNKFLKPVVGIGEHYPTYREFYAQKQFKEMEDYLKVDDSSSIKVGSLGIHPCHF